MAKMQRGLRAGALAFMLTACMLLSALSPAIVGWDGDSNAVGGDDKPDFIYVSLGDSLTNGFGMEGYYADNGDNYSGFLQEVTDAYPTMVKNELSETYDVNLVQLAVSGFRTSELRHLLDKDFPGDIYTDIFGTSTLGERIEAMNGVVREDGHVDVDGDYASPSEYYMDMISKADLITYNLGTNDLGTFITGVVGSKLGFATWSEEQIDIDLGLYIGSRYAGIVDDVNERVCSIITDALTEAGMGPGLSGKLVDALDAIAYAFTYAILGFIVNYDQTLGAIYELNPDADVIVVDLCNAIDSVEFVFEDITVPVGDIYGGLLEIINVYTQYVSPYAVKTHRANLDSNPGVFFDELMVGELTSRDARAAIVEHFELAELVTVPPGTEDEVDYIYSTVDSDGKLTDMLMEIANYGVIDILSVIDGIDLSEINELVKDALIEDRPLTDAEKGLSHIYLRAMVESGMFAHPNRAGHVNITNAIMDAYGSMDEPNEGWLEFYERFLEGGFPVLEEYILDIYEDMRFEYEDLFVKIETLIAELDEKYDFDKDQLDEVLDVLYSYKGELEANLAVAETMLEQGERPSDVILAIGLDDIIADIIDDLSVMENDVAKAILDAIDMGVFDGLVRSYDLILDMTLAFEAFVLDIMEYSDNDVTYYETDEPFYIGGNIYADFKAAPIFNPLRLMDIVEIMGGPESDGRIDLGGFMELSDDLISGVKGSNVIVLETDSGSIDVLLSDLIGYYVGDSIDLDFTRYSDLLGEDVSDWMNGLEDNLRPLLDKLIELYPSVDDIDNIALFMMDRLAYMYLGIYQGMLDANDLVKSYNPHATVLFTGIYNILNNVSVKMDGTSIDIGEVYSEVVRVCNIIIGEYCESSSRTLMVDMTAAVNDTPVVIDMDALNYVALAPLLTKLRYNVDHLKDQVADLLDSMKAIVPEVFIEVEEGSNEATFDIGAIDAEFAVVQSADWTIKLPTSLLEGGEVAKVSLKVMDKDDLPSDIRAFADGKRVISLELQIDGVKRSDFNGNIVTVSVDYVPAEGEDMSDVTVWYMNENELILDKCENARFDASSNRIIFDTTHFSYWMIGHEGSAEPEDDGGVNKIVFIVIGVVAFAALCVVFFRMKR